MKKQDKVRRVMREFKEGSLKSSSGQKVKNPKQAIAIALSEAAQKKANGGIVEIMQPIIKPLSSTGDFKQLGRALGVDERFKRLLDKNQSQDTSQYITTTMRGGGKVKSRVNEAGNYTKPTMRKQLVERIKAGGKGGKPGQWSARKAQMVALQYKAKGGGYKD